MLEIILLIGLLGAEIGLGILSLKKDISFKTLKAQVRLGELLVFILLILSPIISWNFRWYGVGVVLVLQVAIALFKAMKSKKNPIITRGRLIGKLLLKGSLFVFILIPAWVFPERRGLMPTGDYGVKTASYTWADLSRDETFTPEMDQRKITVEFWYPTKDRQSIEKAEGIFPLVIFSHGAFGIKASNTSTYEELASHGYVVCSIDHTYHSFFTEQVDGKAILIDQGFLNEVNYLMLENQGEVNQEKYDVIQGWLKLRVQDMTFCLNQIKAFVQEPNNEEVFSMIDLNNIGLMGHSLGGATAAAVGRQMQDIKAVAVIDGTMLGEEIGIKDGIEQVTTEPYPIPLLNFYNGESYEEIKKIKDIYPNTIASASQKESYQIAITNAGHMNFCDLPMKSPVLAKALGTGTANSKVCIEEVNGRLLTFFDAYLKGKAISLPKEEVIIIK